MSDTAAHSDRSHIRVCDKSDTIDQIAPCIYKREYGSYNNARFCYGEHDLRKGCDAVAAVDFCRLIQFLRYGEEIGPQDNNTERDSKGSVCQDGSQIRIQQAHLGEHNIQGCQDQG